MILRSYLSLIRELLSPAGWTVSAMDIDRLQTKASWIRFLWAMILLVASFLSPFLLVEYGIWQHLTIPVFWPLILSIITPWVSSKSWLEYIIVPVGWVPGVIFLTLFPVVAVGVVVITVLSRVVAFNRKLAQRFRSGSGFPRATVQGGGE